MEVIQINGYAPVPPPSGNADNLIWVIQEFNNTFSKTDWLHQGYVPEQNLQLVKINYRVNPWRDLLQWFGSWFGAFSVFLFLKEYGTKRTENLLSTVKFDKGTTAWTGIQEELQLRLARGFYKQMNRDWLSNLIFAPWDEFLRDRLMTELSIASGVMEPIKKTCMAQADWELAAAEAQAKLKEYLVNVVKLGADEAEAIARQMTANWKADKLTAASQQPQGLKSYQAGGAK